MFENISSHYPYAHCYVFGYIITNNEYIWLSFIILLNNYVGRMEPLGPSLRSRSPLSVMMEVVIQSQGCF